VYSPELESEGLKEAVTNDGLSIEEQVRKKWDPQKGGLPTFLKVARLGNTR
jgi:hypothetical protein